MFTVTLRRRQITADLFAITDFMMESPKTEQRELSGCVSSQVSCQLSVLKMLDFAILNLVPKPNGCVASRRLFCSFDCIIEQSDLFMTNSGSFLFLVKFGRVSSVERFHMTSRWPCWCTKTNERLPYNLLGIEFYFYAITFCFIQPIWP